MGMNMTTIISGILLSFFVGIVFATQFSNMAASFGTSETVDTSSLNYSKTIEAANQIGNVTKEYGALNPLAYFPGLGTLFQVWDVITSAVKDFTQSLESFVLLLGGDPLLNVFKNIMITILVSGITFLILAALFKLGNSWSIK